VQAADTAKFSTFPQVGERLASAKLKPERRLKMFEVQDEIVKKEMQAIEMAINKSAPVVLDVLKAMARWLVQNGDKTFTGKQSIENLVQSGDKLATLPLSSKNIKDFEKIARKYGVDYALEKDTSKDPPQHTLTYRARDTDTMITAFKDYLNMSLVKQKSKKPTFKERVDNAKQRMQSQTKDTEKNQRKGEHEL